MDSVITGEGISSPRVRLAKFLNQKNIADVLKVLHLEKRVSRARIAGITGIAPSTASGIIEKLVGEQIVEFVDENHSSSSIGRPALQVRFSPRSFYVIGVEINLAESRVMVMSIDGTVVLKREIRIDARRDPPKVLAQLSDRIAQLIEESGLDQFRIIGIGVSFRGLIDRQRGLIQRSTSMPDWKNVNIIAGFKERFSVPVYAENNANAMALGETRFGAAHGKKNVLGVVVEEGIGGGIIVNGRLYMGMHSAAGELGHMSVVSSGPICHCGNRGCLRTLASESAIEVNALRIVKTGVKTLLKSRQESKDPSMTVQDVVEAARKGDDVSKEIILEAARFLGIALVDLVNILSPEIIILNEGILTLYPPFMEEIRQSIVDRSYAKELGLPEITLSKLASDAVCVGAASVVLDRIFVGN